MHGQNKGVLDVNIAQMLNTMLDFLFFSYGSINHRLKE